MKKVIILNAPPNAGKDTIAEVLCERLEGQHCEFKAALYETTLDYYGLPSYFTKYFTDRALKEVPNRMFMEELPVINTTNLCTFTRSVKEYIKVYFAKPLSPREALIHVSEDIIKPVEGKDYFGKKAAEGLKDGWNIFSDGGFIEELQPIIDEVGKEHVYIIRFSRKGCSFEGDSRDYLPEDTGCPTRSMDNNGTIDEFCDEVKCIWRVKLQAEKHINNSGK